MKHILFPTDFSENAKNAIFYGLSLYRDEPCKYTILNTTPIIYDSSGFPIFISDVITENANKSFSLLKEQINKEFKNNNFIIETEARIGELVTIINSLVKRKKIGQIVMGTQGASGLTEVLMGSNTASVIKHVKCPVLAIPQKANYKKPKKIVLALEKDMVTSKRVINPLLEIATKFKSEILLLHVVNNNEEEKVINKKKTALLLKDIKFSFHLTFNEDVPLGIEIFLKEQHADMLVMISHEMKFIDRIFHRSVTKKVSFHTELPLLVMHDKK